MINRTANWCMHPKNAPDIHLICNIKICFLFWTQKTVCITRSASSPPQRRLIYKPYGNIWENVIKSWRPCHQKMREEISNGRTLRHISIKLLSVSYIKLNAKVLDFHTTINFNKLLAACVIFNTGGWHSRCRLYIL